MNSSINELTNVVSKEHALLDWCRDLLSTCAALQVKLSYSTSFPLLQFYEGKDERTKRKGKGFFFAFLINQCATANCMKSCIIMKSSSGC